MWSVVVSTRTIERPNAIGGAPASAARPWADVVVMGGIRPNMRRREVVLYRTRTHHEWLTSSLMGRWPGATAAPLLDDVPSQTVLGVG
jgi:hypothetical protein